MATSRKRSLKKGVGNFWISLKVVPYVLFSSCEGIFPGIELVVTAFKFTGP